MLELKYQIPCGKFDWESVDADEILQNVSIMLELQKNIML